MLYIDGFDWDQGNWPKCAKHGLTKAVIESVFQNQPMIAPDPNQGEERLRAIGQSDEGRYVFLVFTLRHKNGKQLIRVISARYMHSKEIDHYVKR